MRLIPFSTLLVAGMLLVFISSVGMLAFRSYILTLQADQRTTVEQISNALKKDPQNEKKLTFIIETALPALYRRSINITLITATRRVLIYYPRDLPLSGKPRVVDRPRERAWYMPPGDTPFSHFLYGLATVTGEESPHVLLPDVEIYTSIDEQGLFEEVSHSFPVFAAALIVILLLSFLSGRFLNREALRPLVEVTDALERFARGDFTPRFVQTAKHQELYRLAQAFNGAAAQVELSFKRNEQTAVTMRSFIADAGHQLRTPLTVIRGFLNLLGERESISAEEYERGLHIMRRQALLMETMVSNLILLDQLEQPVSAGSTPAVDVLQLVTDIVDIQCETHPGREITFSHTCPVPPMSRIDPHDLNHALTNLIDNACKYTAGAVRISMHCSANEITLDVIDEGPGMNADVAASAFDRFGRGDRRDVAGSGLGLPIAKRAVERSGGSIRLYSSRQSGSHFIVTLTLIA